MAKRQTGDERDERLEPALQESTRRLLQAQRVAGLGFWDWDLHSRQIVASTQAFRICGLEPSSEPVDNDFFKRVGHPDDVVRMGECFEDALAGKRDFDLDVRIVLPDGQIRWVNTAAEITYDAAGKPVSLLGTLLDITQRKLVELALRESEQRLRLLHALGEAARAAAAPEGFMPLALELLGEYLQVTRCSFGIMDADGDTFSIPHEYKRDGISVVGRHRLSSYGPRLHSELAAGRTVVLRNIQRELPAEEAQLFEQVRDQALVCCSLLRHGALQALMSVVSATPRNWTEDEIKLIEDVAARCWSTVEHCAAEARLRQQAAMLRIASDAARVGGWRVELQPEQRVIWSDEACEILEVPTGESRTLEQSLLMCAPEARDIAVARLTECAQRGTPFDIELQLVTGPGRRLWARVVGQAERDARGQITRVNGALQDIDDRHRLEEQLRQVQKMDAVGQLAGGVAHDFNNLLSVILSYSQLIVSTLEPDNPMRADVEEILRAGTRAGELTQQLLAFSRQQMRQPRIVDLNQVLDDMDKMLRRLLNDDITLSMHTSPGPLTIFVDPGQIEQVVLNLVINARDAMPSGGSLRLETSQLEVDTQRAEPGYGLNAGSYVLLAISDTGIGMSAATRARIFEPFFTTKEKTKGTGLGLSTVHGIVAQSGGQIVVQSELGHGTTFRLYFPRVAPAFEPTAAQVPQPLSLRGDETVLVVDDEDQVRAIACAVLRRNGYDVLEAQNAGEAFLICERHPTCIHLLLTDVVMPRVSGRELAERVAAMRPDVRVLYMSGYAQDSIVQQGVIDPNLAFLHKPITPNALLLKVREVLDR